MTRTIVSVTYTFEVFSRKALRRASWEASKGAGIRVWQWARQRRDSADPIGFDVDTVISFDAYSAGLRFRDGQRESFEVAA